MQAKPYFVEKPNHLMSTDEMEFFLWDTPPDAVAAAAHVHDAVELLYITQGSFLATIDGEEYRLKPGDLILFRSHVIHHVLTLGEPYNQYYVLKLKPMLLQSLSARREAAACTMQLTLQRPDSPCVWTQNDLQNSHILHTIRALIEESNQNEYAKDIALKLGAANLLLYLLRDCHAKERTFDGSRDEIAQCIYRALIHIRQNFTQELDEKTLAAQAGVSYCYFSRHFKRVTGMCFKDYLNALRINYAEQLLLTTGCSVTEVATECGYNNISYFISMYKRLKRVTPKQTANRVER